MFTRTPRETAHLLLDLPVGVVGFVMALLASLVARPAAMAERARARALLGVEADGPPPSPWRAALYFLLMLPVGTATFTAAVSWWAVTLLLVSLPAWAWTQDHGWTSPGELAASTAVGLVLLAATPAVIHAITKADRSLLRLIAR